MKLKMLFTDAVVKDLSNFVFDFLRVALDFSFFSNHFNQIKIKLMKLKMLLTDLSYSSVKIDIKFLKSCI